MAKKKRKRAGPSGTTAPPPIQARSSATAPAAPTIDVAAPAIAVAAPAIAVAPAIDVAARSPRTRPEIGTFLLLSLQLGLLLAVALRYALELERGFDIVGALTLGGFMVHYWLPTRFRLPFFLSLSLVALVLMLGLDGLWLIGMALALIGLVHLPIPWLLRLLLVLGVSALLVLLRAHAIEEPWGPMVLPILASLFMFRLALYLYDLKKAKTPATIWQRLTYFFLLPNMSAPLFPVVDYRTYLRSWRQTTDPALYQRGILWIMRGIGHLLVYRIVYHLLPQAGTDLTGAFGVYVVMAMTFALYLRLSGIFHLVTGILLIFGFDLPPTHKHYFLATSFSDLWRRVNIYWKDFMANMVFYPVFVQLGRLGIDLRLVIATAIVVVFTWLLHAYQWFWLRGVFLLADTDIIFWSILGVALIINNVWESRRGKRKPDPTFTWRGALSRSGRTLAFFSVMTVLWSMWQSESLDEWLALVGRVDEGTGGDWLALVALLASMFTLGTLAQWVIARRGISSSETAVGQRAPWQVFAFAVVLLVIGLPPIQDAIPDNVARAHRLLSYELPNAIDEDREERGYYEELTRSTRLGTHDTKRPEDWIGLQDSEFARKTKDLRSHALKPSMAGDFKGASFTTNRWAMRDRDYEQKKPPGTHRIAILGASVEMGAGVEDAAVFDNLVEGWLEEDWAGEPGHFRRYEVLNFAVGGYTPLSYVIVAEEMIQAFEPDVVICFVHPTDSRRILSRLDKFRRWRHWGPRDAYLKDLIDGLGPGELTRSEIVLRLRGHGPDLLKWAQRRTLQGIRAAGAIPVFALMPTTGVSFTDEAALEFEAFARSEGALVLSLNGIFDAYPSEEIWAASWDEHPSTLGHELMAKRLYSELERLATELKLR